ncbi:Pyridoxal phosphate homeostasis protein, YggS-family [Desulfonema limicola]|uniref:Pyridoxal phosphate homeostasis protein n=1 Tax=Desulfonema limicola TaxID=45656 RepID=A0A975BAH6_9BACT|nr:YggS family pyridoxal phosphate-dependent enzyme [Desulfonema limicola]QTA81654.1 Pyridoxal phosphate homeostasis protein, YggS-family [Desulfonema limicola]
MSITENYLKIRNQVPEHVTIVLACKKRTPKEVAEVIDAGASDIGENYVQEGGKMFDALGDKAYKARWHMIGPLQKNKINKALRIFDSIQTVHSCEQAADIDKRAQALGKKVSVFIEINIGEESAKSGIAAEYEAVKSLAEDISNLGSLNLEGIMTMGPFYEDPENIRPYFRRTKEIFDKIKSLNLPDTDMKYLSMGMSDSYKVAIEEGSNMIRLGTIIFGPRI